MSATGSLYPVDVSADDDAEVLWATTNAYFLQLVQQRESSTETFSISEEEKVKIEEPNVSFLPLFQEDCRHKILVLVNPKDKAAVLAVYVNASWWGVEDVLKTSDPSREGVMKVSSLAERVVLFVLNCLVFGILERRPSEEEDAVFVPHSAKEHAKIFWQAGEAVAFYSIKRKGSLCAGSTNLCYLLPVLDTVFVRRKCRRRGLGLKMLEDFSQSFTAEDALGVSCPLSPAMYQVCQKFLQLYPEERERLWEVEAPGDWSQRENIWLKIQLGHAQAARLHDLRKSSEEKGACGAEGSEDDEPRLCTSREYAWWRPGVAGLRGLSLHGRRCPDLHPVTLELPLRQRESKCGRDPNLCLLAPAAWARACVTIRWTLNITLHMQNAILINQR
ncbi:protein FAM169B isoform X2 [Rhinatrema bivittatum]|uniref:protein FAM169B isoform X2 n=1 Tax=Rhinatrema bivittatum TaxID=194408 RepID=UPI00112DCB43|nr:protein FAM169B isoform X2 [Rhinatrema bivittatum]